MQMENLSKGSFTLTKLFAEKSRVRCLGGTTTLSIMTFSIMTFSIMTFSITILCIKGLFLIFIITTLCYYAECLDLCIFMHKGLICDTQLK